MSIIDNSDGQDVQSDLTKMYSTLGKWANTAPSTSLPNSGYSTTTKESIIMDKENWLADWASTVSYESTDDLFRQVFNDMVVKPIIQKLFIDPEEDDTCN